MAILQGDTVTLSAEFKDSSGVFVDLPKVVFKLKLPEAAGGTVTTYTYGVDSELIKDSTGKYHVDYAITDFGKFSYGFYGISSSDIGLAAEEGSFTAKISAFTEV